jgi:hypothetical protein
VRNSIIIARAKKVKEFLVFKPGNGINIFWLWDYAVTGGSGGGRRNF